jgi:hypothetical protein
MRIGATDHLAAVTTPDDAVALVLANGLNA